MNKKLIQTAFLLGSFLIVAGYSFGGVVTGSMIPNVFSSTTTGNATYDIDNNGQFDFKVTRTFSGGLNFEGLNGTQFETNGSSLALGFNLGTPLGTNSYQANASMHETYFPAFMFRFVSLKFKINGVYHCAYFGVYSDYPNLKFTLGSFGYETDPNTCMKAGQYPLSVNNQKNTNVRIFPNPSSGKLAIQLKENMASIHVEVLNVRGQVIQKANYTNGQHIELNILKPKGVYFVRITADNKREIIKWLKL